MALLLPVNMNIDSLVGAIAAAIENKHNQNGTVQIEKIYLDGRLKFLLVLLGRGLTKVNMGD